MKTKARVTGIRWIFFKTKNPKKVLSWHKKHLGLPLEPELGAAVSFDGAGEDPKKKGSTVWSAFEASTGLCSSRARSRFLCVFCHDH